MRKTNKSDIKNNTKKPTRDEAFLHKAGGEAKAKTNLFESITDRIIQVIEAGEATGSISWAGQGGRCVPVIHYRDQWPDRGPRLLHQIMAEGFEKR